MNGVDPLARLRRDLACTTRIIGDVLKEVADGALRVEHIARNLRLDEDDVRGALFALEHAGLVESRGYNVTPIGRAAAREMEQ